jgi:ferrous iron transport protein B
MAARAELIDLPGTYSLVPRSPDEAVTRDTLLGLQAGERRPMRCHRGIDATNLRNHLRFVLDVKALDMPLVVALNMIDWPPATAS